MTRATAIISLLILNLTGCSEAPPSAPYCRVDLAFEDPSSGNSACIIRFDNKLLTVIGSTTDKLDVPGGRANEGESAQCTAHRKTWEETGFNVEVGRFLGMNRRQFRFYDCRVDAGFSGQITEFPVNDWHAENVSAIRLVDPFETEFNEWRFADELVILRDVFNQSSNSAEKTDEE